MTKLIAGLVLLLIFPVAGGAQNLPTASRNPDSDWYRAFDIRFNPGQADEAIQIAADHFEPVDQALGREVLGFVHESGEWDQTVYIPMDGPGEMVWNVSPIDEEWWARLAEQEGGAEQAMAVFASYTSKVADYRVTIVRRPH